MDDLIYPAFGAVLAMLLVQLFRPGWAGVIVVGIVAGLVAGRLA